MRSAARFQGPVTGFTGYGKLFAWLVKRLKRMRGISLEVTAHRGRISPSAPDELVQSLARKADHRYLGLLLATPDETHLIPTVRRVHLTMWETTRLPNIAIQGLNANATEAWVTSDFCLSVFRDCLTVPVRKVGCGVDSSLFTLGDLRDRNKLTFGTMGVMSRRKGVDVLLRAWGASLADKEDARLLIKTRDTRWLPPEATVFPNVQVFEGDWEHEKVVQFYQALDYFVLPTRGEGYGLCPIEAACCGTPGFVTRWSGPVDYLSRYIQPIEVLGLYGIPEGGAIERSGQWAEPNADHLVFILRDCYERGGPTEEERRLTSRWARGNWDIQPMAEAIAQGLRRLSR